MKKLIKLITVIAAVFTCSNTLAGTKPVENVIPTPVAEVEAVNAKAFAACVIKNSDRYEFGGGLALEARLAGNLYGEIVGSLYEDEAYTLGVNLLYYVPVSESVSLYALTGGSYEFETDQWTVGVGGGLSVKLADGISLFADGTYNFTVEKEQEDDGATTIRAGLRLSF